MADLNIKPATIEDLEDIALISRTTWDGEDYLEGKAPEWIKDSTLYAGDLVGRVGSYITLEREWIYETGR